jgi:putative toxin-antitoxin system antitoxin component (TIGR02293 family)
MPNLSHHAAASAELAIFPHAMRLLGGSKTVKHQPTTQAEVHRAAVHGMPYSALFFLTERNTTLREDDIAQVLGISTRTLRRHKEAPNNLMPPDLGSKAWLFAEILAKAETVFGGRTEAERWMADTAAGLDGARPIELLRTLQGANLVSQFLDRLSFGVYT